MATVFMFSGQGSQYYGMGHELYQREPVFRAAMDRLDEIAAAAVGESVLARMYEPGRGRAERFDTTVLTHPAIVMVELALAELLAAEGVRPDVLLGASLGEFTAAVLAGVLTEAECLRVLVGQARALAGLPAGGMLAVLAEADWYTRSELLRERTDLAAVNFAGHFVLSGADPDLAAAEEFLLRNDIAVQRVPVGYAFHSRLMDARHDACLALLDGVHPKPPKLRLLSCATSGEVTSMSAEHFWRVTRQPIRFSDTVLGLETEGPHRYLDLGPAGTLHNFVRNLLPSGSASRSFPLLSPFSTDTKLLADARTAVRPRPANPKGDAMLVYGFPGQGSQLKGMGADLFDEFATHTATADEVLGYSIRELCLANPDDRLRQTQFTQPALYVVEALDYLHRQATGAPVPDCLVGHSVGEYTALFAAGAFDFETGLRLVRKRGELMAAAGGGTMAAVIGIPLAAVESVIAQSGLSTLDIANLNAPDQIVLAGPEADIDRARPLFEANGAHFVRLRVSAPFHSRYMRPVMDEFAAFLATRELRDPRLPVIANTDARPYRPGTVREVLVRQIGSPVQWVDTVRYLMGRGEFEFTEVGPGKVLTKLVTKIRNQATPLVVADEPQPGTPIDAVPMAAVPVAAVPVDGAPSRLRAADLGAAGFRDRYGLRYGYVAGALCHGISGTELVSRLARAGGMGVFGTEGLSLAEVEAGLRALRDTLGPDGPFAANLLYQHADPDRELALVDLFLRLGVRVVEAAGFLQLTPALLKYRLHGGRILATVSRADMAEMFLSPPPDRVVRRLLDQGQVTEEQARTAAAGRVADDLCVAADGGWLAGVGSMSTVLPTVLRLRDRLAGTDAPVHVGAAGGIGTPEAAAAAFLLGADFVLTGSINQCTVEAATSPTVKDLLSQLDVHDVDSAPWPAMFELGVRANVVKRSVFFPARANKLYELWRRHESPADLDAATRTQLAEVFLGLPNQAALTELADAAGPAGKQRLAALCRGYFDRAMRFALTGDTQHRVDYLVYCGPAMGAFNQWVHGTDLERWQARHVDVVAERLLDATATLLAQRCARFAPQPATGAALAVAAPAGSTNGNLFNSNGGRR